MVFKKGMGKIVGSGRKKGVKNRVQSWLAKEMEKITNGEPVPILMLKVGLRCLRDGRDREAIHALSEACGYAYHKLKAVELSGEVKQAPQLVISLAETQGQHTEGTNNDKA